MTTSQYDVYGMEPLLDGIYNRTENVDGKVFWESNNNMFAYKKETDKGRGRRI